MAANSALKLFNPYDYDFVGVTARIEGGASLRAARAWVKKGPATEDVVPADTEPKLICDSDCLLAPLLMLVASLTSSPAFLL